MAATPENLMMMMVRRLLPKYIWQSIAIGRANLELTAMGLALGGNACAGVEDCLFLRKGVMARKLDLAGRAAALSKALSLEVADVPATEQLLALSRT